MELSTITRELIKNIVEAVRINCLNGLHICSIFFDDEEDAIVENDRTGGVIVYTTCDCAVVENLLTNIGRRFETKPNRVVIDLTDNEEI